MTTTLRFEAYDPEDHSITTVGRDSQDETWMDQADLFYEFLIGQGFIVTEIQLSQYFMDKAVEIMDLRSNIKVDKTGHNPYDAHSCPDCDPNCRGNCS